MFFGTADQNFYKLNGATGAKMWSVAFQGPITGSAAIGVDGACWYRRSTSVAYAHAGVVLPSQASGMACEIGRHGVHRLHRFHHDCH